ncbi:MAG: ArgE/DapE family deacylase [Candidatus Hodarchaeota archaeon]
MEQKILAKVEEKEKEITELLRRVIRIPSLTGEEGEAQEFLADYLKDLGMEVSIWEPDVKEIFDKFPEVAQYPSHWKHDLILSYDRFASYEELVKTGKIELLNYKNRPNVVGVLKGLGGGRSLLLTGHIDNVTVEPKSDWTHDPFGAEIVNGKIYGRGASDMKGGLIAALSAIQCVIEAGVPLKGDVIFASAVNEEHSGNGTLSMVCKGVTADAAIVHEPSENQIFVAHTGDVYWQLTAKGVPRSPGARWDGKEMVGVSAIEKLPSVIQSLLGLEEEHNKMKADPLYEMKNPFSCVIGEVSGGTYAGATASRCILRGCVYFSPGLGSVSEIMDRIKEYIAKGTQSDPWFEDHPVETAFLRHKNCTKIDKDHPIVKTVYDCSKAVNGKDPSILGSPYGTDMETLVNLGKIPTVIYGPGSITYAHKADELISIDEYISSVKVLALTIYRWCK